MAATTVRAANFWPTALRLARRMGPHRRLIAAVFALSLGGIALGVAGPRILGHATDLVFDGILGRGRNVVAEILVPEHLVHDQLRSTAARPLTSGSCWRSMWTTSPRRSACCASAGLGAAAVGA